MININSEISWNSWSLLFRSKRHHFSEKYFWKKHCWCKLGGLTPRSRLNRLRWIASARDTCSHAIPTRQQCYVAMYWV